jgi:type IV pilus assembly protein PilF
MRGMLALWALSMAACSPSMPPLDTLTYPELSNTQQRAMLRLNLASAYFEQGQNTVAQQEVRAALKIDPTSAEAYSLLGLIHQRDNSPQLAQQSFEQALVLAAHPPVRGDQLASIEHNYAWFLCQQNRFNDAQRHFDKALAQPSYRQTDKTLKAIGFCQARAGASPQL